MTDARTPNDPMLERDAIALCVARPELIPTIGLCDDDFAIECHRLVWRAMSELFELGDPVDLVRVRSRLIDADSLAQAGGENALGAFRSVATPKALPVDRLIKLRKLRALRAQAEAVAAAAAGNDPDMAAAALEATNALASEPTHTKRPKTARDLCNEWFESLTRDPNEGTVSPGLPPLKRVIGRLDCGSMTLIGADVNTGKSTLALEMMLLALLDGENVGYLSMEDPEKIVTQRIMAAVGGVSPKKIRRYVPGSGDSEIDKAMQVMHAINGRLLVSNCIGMNERETLEQMTLMAKSGARLIVLDYIGVVGCSVRQQDRRNEIRWIATRFKARSVYTKTALVVVSQFSRPKEGDSARKPTKHSFRESGDLEAMAEYAITMWRKVEDDYAPVYCELAKSKTGGVGYGWTMQREIDAVNSNGARVGPGSGRLVEVRHTREPILRDDNGSEIRIRDVMADPIGANRWSVEDTSR